MMTHPDFERLTGMPAIRYILLQKYQLVFDEDETGYRKDAVSESQLQALDVIFAKYGFAMSSALRHHIAGYDDKTLISFMKNMAASLRSICDSYEEFVPLYYDFPNNVPTDMEQEWQKRFISVFRNPDEPCLYCGSRGTTYVLKPCYHVVCNHCFDMSKFSACPVCQRHIEQTPMAPYRPQGDEIVHFKRIDFGPDIRQTIIQAFAELCKATMPLSKLDYQLLTHICEEFGSKVVRWMPGEIPLRENIALIFGILLKNGVLPDFVTIARKYIDTATDVLRLIAVMSGCKADLLPVQTAKSIKVYSLKDLDRLPLSKSVSRKRIYEQYPDDWVIPQEGLVLPLQYLDNTFKICKLSRSARRMILSLLESMHNDIAEDMLRHRAKWIHVGAHALHPGEYAKKYPKTFKAFQLLRRKSPDGTKAPKILTWNSIFETCMKTGDINKAKEILEERPGELARRLDWLMRNLPGHQIEQKSGAETLKTMVEGIGENLFKPMAMSRKIKGIALTIKNAAKDIQQIIDPKAAANDMDPEEERKFIDWAMGFLAECKTPVLATLYQHLAIRQRPLPIRKFTPRNIGFHQYFSPDRRKPLPASLASKLRTEIKHELINGFRTQCSYDSCLIDQALNGLPMVHGQPMNGDSGAALAPGSIFALPKEGADTIRLFLHWCQNKDGNRADLDLSVIFYDENWGFIDTCCYFNNTAQYHHTVLAVHSGDFQDAPWPDGSTEFVDIKREQAKAVGARYAVMTVMCYNNIYFNQLSRAFTGVMFRQDDKAAYFDPRTVRYKFALDGILKNYIPVVFDLQKDIIHYTDFYISTKNSININAMSESQEIVTLSKKMIDYSGYDSHINRYHLAILEAIARCKKIYIRQYDGKIHHYIRRNNETDDELMNRIMFRNNDMISESYSSLNLDNDKPILAYLLNGDIALPKDSECSVVFGELVSSTVDWSMLYHMKRAPMTIAQMWGKHWGLEPKA